MVLWINLDLASCLLLVSLHGSKILQNRIGLGHRLLSSSVEGHIIYILAFVGKIIFVTTI